MNLNQAQDVVSCDRNPTFPALSQDEQLLLKAAFLDSHEASDAWQQWQKSVEIEDVDTKSFPLLPLVYRNLSQHQVKDAELMRLKGICRSRWYKNQLLLKKLTSIVSNLAANNIEVLILNDAALLLQYYQDHGVRSIYQFDILVSPLDVATAISKLQKIGWSPKVKIPERLRAIFHSIPLQNKSQQLLNLHWRLNLSPEKFGNKGNLEESTNYQNFCKNRNLIKIGDCSTYALNSTDSLLYLCRNELSNKSKQTSILYLADAMTIIKSAEADINWNLLMSKAQKHHLLNPLKNMLSTLAAVLNYPISNLNLKLNN